MQPPTSDLPQAEVCAPLKVLSHSRWLWSGEMASPADKKAIKLYKLAQGALKQSKFELATQALQQCLGTTSNLKLQARALFSLGRVNTLQEVQDSDMAALCFLSAAQRDVMERSVRRDESKLGRVGHHHGCAGATCCGALAAPRRLRSSCSVGTRSAPWPTVSKPCSVASAAPYAGVPLYAEYDGRTAAGLEPAEVRLRSFTSSPSRTPSRGASRNSTPSPNTMGWRA